VIYQPVVQMDVLVGAIVNAGPVFAIKAEEWTDVILRERLMPVVTVLIRVQPVNFVIPAGPFWLPTGVFQSFPMGLVVATMTVIV
jgi:hypothetical protein